MSKINKLFATPKKAVLSFLCAAAILLTLGVGTAYAAEAVAESSAIGAENAQNFAFADAGIDPVAAQVDRTEFDFEMGQFVYEVEFVVNGTEYEYWIKASNGTVLKKSVEIVTLDGTNVVATAKITLEQAKEAALADAGLSESQVSFTEGKLDVENGLSVYDISFYAENVEYEYEINADTGAIYSKSKETVIAQLQEDTVQNEGLAPTQTKPNANPAPAQTQPPASKPAENRTDEAKPVESTQIDLNTAKQKALADAGVSASAVTFTKAHLDYDDGIAMYDIEFYTATHEYDYEINASTGAVHERSVEALEYGPARPGDRDQGTQGNTEPAQNSGTGTATPAPEPSPNTAPASYIGVESAKGIAVGNAGLSASEVTFRKAKLDVDDGLAVYEISFYCNGMEYDCEINASTGAILEFDCERDD